MIPDYIEQRIRRPLPAGAFIVPGSTPVVSFGDAQRAVVATLGLNPSRIEFRDNRSGEFVGNARRLATHTSLGTSDLTAAPPETVLEVLQDCNTYFERNPYRRWFDQLTPILAGCGASYYDGSACHLDLVQWATDPTWSGIRAASVRRQLLADDAVFLVDQLRNANLRLLLVNGTGVSQQLRHVLAVELDGAAPIIGDSWFDTRLLVGTIFNRIRVVCWSTNVQSQPGVTRWLRAELARRVAALAQD